MIKRAQLRDVKTIVVHENSPGNPCPDGTASALILRDVLPSVEIRFVSYNHPSLDEIPATPGMLFCDITPPKVRAKEFLDVGALVFDHHEQQRDVTMLFVERGLGEYGSDPGVSGAMLAYREVWLPLTNSEYVDPDVLNEVKTFANLAGIRDTWQKESPLWEASCAQAAALKFWSFSDFPLRPFEDHAIDPLMQIGPILIRQVRERARRSVEEAAYLVSKKGTQVAIIATTETSDAAEMVNEETDIFAGFRFLVRKGIPLMVLSFRARGSYDVGSLAKSLNGGGHRSAAGATLIVLEGTGRELDPYRYIVDLIDQYESKS